MKRILFTFTFIWIFVNPVLAEVNLPAVFSDNMVLQQNAEVKIWGWAKPDIEVSIKPSWSKKVYYVQTDASGKWHTMINTPQHGGPYTVTITDDDPVIIKNVLIGEVWVCSGQSNMAMQFKHCTTSTDDDILNTLVLAGNPDIRLFTVPNKVSVSPETNVEGSWVEASPGEVYSFSAVAYYFGRLLNRILDVPVGIIHSSYGGSSIEAWIPCKVFNVNYLENTVELDKVTHPNKIPGVLFNGMINPILGYGIRGVIWYQGEANCNNPKEYAGQMEEMVKTWRNLWEMGDFPFYYVQIAPYRYSEKVNSAYLREAQLNALSKIPHASMVVNMDANSPDNIHPPVKIKTGERLAHLALAGTYGIKGIPCHYPSLISFEVKGQVVELIFNVDGGTGLTSFGKKIDEFTIADSTKRFVPATATIIKNKVLVFSPRILNPLAVRYAFGNTSGAEIFSLEGLPVSSFRTDNWD